MAQTLAELQADLAAARIELAVRQTNFTISPTNANAAAVTALQERVNSDEEQIDVLETQALQPPTQPITPPPTIGLTGPPPPAPPTTTTPTSPVIAPTGLGDLTPAAVAAALVGYLSDDDAAVGAFLDSSGTETSATDAWDYLRDAVENVFSDFASTFDDLGDVGFGVDTGISIVELGGETTASIADFPAVLVILGLLIGEYLTGKLLDLIAKVFPNPSVFGWHPLNFIQSGITSLGNQFATSAEDLLKDITNVLVQPIRMVVGLFQRAINTIAGAHDKTARIVQDTVPSAITTAQTYTDKKVSDQAAAINQDAAQALAQLSPPPTVQEARQILNYASEYGGLVWQFEAVAASAIIAAGTYTDEQNGQTASQIATAKAQAEADAQTAVANLQAQLLSRLSGDENTLSSLTNSVNVTIPNEIATQVNEAEATENQKLTAAQTQLQGEIDSLQAQVTTLANAVTAATQTISTAQANIATLQSAETVDEGAIANEQQIIATAQSTIATNTTAISELYTQITGISDQLGPINATQALQTSQITNLTQDTTVLLPVALAALSTALTSLKTEVDECMVDNCNTQNPNNIQNVLRDLLGLLTAAAEIGFVAEAIRDPLGTANALAPLLESIDTGAVNTLDALLSL